MTSPIQPFAAAATQRVAITVPVWETRSGTPLFELAGTDCAIVGDVSASARGLSVEQHTERVLVHLLGERDAPL